MAAWYISTLSNGKQIKLLEKTFWEHRYYNTWIMYVGITGGRSFALRHFKSGNWFQLYSKVFGASKVSSKFLKHKMKCLHLFQCLVEADKPDIIKSVKLLFENKQIDLSNQALLPSDLNTFGFFLINKEWDELNLSNCGIGSNGSNVLCDRLLDNDVRCIVTIKMVNFSYNQLNFPSLIRLFDLFNSWHTSEIIITDDISLGKTIDSKTIEDTVLQSSTLALVLIISYLFCKNAEFSKVHHILSNTTNIRSVYLLNCAWILNDSDASKSSALFRKQQLHKVRIINSSLNTSFINTLTSILLNNNDSVNMLVYDPTMSDETADDISSSVTSSNKDISGVILIVSNSKVQGIVNTYSLSNELSTLEILNLSVYIRYLNSKMCPWRKYLESATHNKEIIFTFIKLIHKSNSTWKLKIILWESSTLIVHQAKFERLDKFIHFANNNIYLSNCDVQYDVINEACSTLHILNSPECIELLHNKLLNKQSVPNTLFFYGNIKYNVMNSLIELLSLDHLNISAVLAVNDIIVGIHPSSELIALAFQLQPLPTALILSNADGSSAFYQLIDALVTIPEWDELDFTGCDVGDEDCEIVQSTFTSNNYSFVRKLNISFNRLSVIGIRNLATIVLMCKIQELNINGTNDILLDCLIKNLTCNHQNSCFLTIIYNHRILLVLRNTSWDKITTKMDTQVYELYVMNCETQLYSTEIIDYLHTTHNLLRLCIINCSISTIVITEIIQLISNKSIEVSISDVRIIDDDRMIRKLLTHRELYNNMKFNFVLSTDRYLCIYNATKYQLQLIHKYFMNQPNNYAMSN